MAFVSSRDEKMRSADINFQEEFSSKSSFDDVIAASIGQTFDEELSISSKLNREGWSDRKRIVEGLIDSGALDKSKYSRSSLPTPSSLGGLHSAQFDYEAASLDFEEIKDHKTLSEERNQLLKMRRDYANDVFERGSGTARFLGAATAFMLDPISIATMPIGYSVGAAKGLRAVGKAALKIGATEMAVETGIQAFVFDHKEEIDSPYGYQDAITNIGTAALGSALLGGTAMGIKEYISHVRLKTKDLPDSEQLQFADETLARLEETLSNNPLRKEGMTSKELVNADKEFLTELEVRRDKVELAKEPPPAIEVNETPYVKPKDFSTKENAVLKKTGELDGYNRDIAQYNERFNPKSDAVGAKKIESKSGGESYLYEVDPKTLKVSETEFKDVSNYRGDASKPISVAFIDGEAVILDGHHRAKLAAKEGNKIKAVVIPKEDYLAMKADGLHQTEMFREFALRVGEGKAGKAINKADADAILAKRDELMAKGVSEGEADAMAVKAVQDDINFEIDDIVKQSGVAKKDKALPEGVPVEMDGKMYDSNQFISEIDTELKGIDSIMGCLYK